MVLLALAVLLGFVAARARHPLGAWAAARPRFTWIPALGVGAALNVAAYVLEGTPATLALVASLVVLLGFVAVNARLTGIVVIGVGLLLNLVAVVANDGMPVRGSALVAAGVLDEAELSTVGFSGPRHLERDSDLLPVLGDVLPLALPVAPEVLSFGDLIVVFGAGDAVRDLARRRRRRWSAEERTAFAHALASGATAAPGLSSAAWGAEPGAPLGDETGSVDVLTPDEQALQPPAHGPQARRRTLVTTSGS